MDGLTSVLGRNVPLSVEVVLRREVELAVTQLQLTVERTVKETQRNFRIVTLLLVQV